MRRRVKAVLVLRVEVFEPRVCVVCPYQSGLKLPPIPSDTLTYAINKTFPGVCVFYS
jgi:hypothetical protein